MFEFIKNLFSKKNVDKKKENEVKAEEIDIYELKNELKSLELQIQEKDKEINSLSKQLDYEKKTQEKRMKSVIEQKMEQVIVDTAQPISMLFTQIYLSKPNPVQVRDILINVKRLINTYKTTIGMEINDEVGKEIEFNNIYHQSLNSKVKINNGEKVKVKFPSIKYKKNILRKAIVEKKNK
ncbi:MAG: hypothetical protein ABF289_12875 [Clostridiales bacterium]